MIVAAATVGPSGGRQSSPPLFSSVVVVVVVFVGNVLVAVTPWTPCHHSVDLSWKRTIFQYIYICCYHRSRYEVYHPQSAHQHPVLVQVLRTRRQRTFGPCRQVSLVPMESCWMVRGPSSKYLAIYFELISLDLTIKMSHATTNQNNKIPQQCTHVCTNSI